MSKNRIDESFNKIEENFEKISEKNKKELEYALIHPIHEKFPFAQNGICAMITSMGSGKSYNYIKNIAKQEVLDENELFFELFGYICFIASASCFVNASRSSSEIADNCCNFNLFNSSCFFEIID